MSFFQWQKKDLLLKLHVQPNAKENKVVGLHGGSLKLKIKSLPVDNKANKDIALFLSKEFKVSKSNIGLVSGQTSRKKQFIIKDVKVSPKWFEELSAKP